METENKDHIEEILRRFLTKGETMNWDELRAELGKDEYAHVKKELLRMRAMRMKTNRERIWNGVQENLQRDARRRRLLRVTRYAAILILPLSLFLLFWLNQEKELAPVNVATVGTMDSTGIRKAYLVLEGGAKIELSAPHLDTIRQEDGLPLAVDTLGKLVYNTVEEEVEQLFYHKIVVPRGGEYTVELNDGTRVRLNADSELRFPVKFASNERKVFLKGEAYFEVSKTGQPFIVQTKGMKIEVLGTTFNISAYANEEYQTTLVSGSVKVQTENGSNRILKPSEQACITPGSNQINVRNVDTAFYTSWIHGKINFKDQRLDDIMKTLARWYDMDVVYENEATKELRFGCYVNRYNEITPLVKLLEQTGRVTVTVEGKTIKIFTNH